MEHRTFPCSSADFLASLLKIEAEMKETEDKKAVEPGFPILSEIPKSPLGESTWSRSTLTVKNTLLQEQANQEELNKDEELEKVEEPITSRGKRSRRTPTSPPTTPSNSTPTSSNNQRCGRDLSMP